MSTHEILILIDYISLAVMAVCTAIICFHVESQMQKFASYASILLTFCSLGFLFKAEATDLDMLVVGQKIVYAFIAHAVFSMLVFIISYCRYRLSKAVIGCCLGVDMFISALVLTNDYTGIFYKNCWAVDAGGYLVLEKEYGIGHTLTLAVFMIYMLVSVGLAVAYTIRSRKRGSSFRSIWKLIVAVLIPYSAYLLPKLLNTENELQPMAFAVFLVMVLYMIYKDNLYDVNNILARYSVASIEDGVAVFDKDGRYKGCNALMTKLFPKLADMGMDMDIRKDLPEFEGILDGSIKEFKAGDETYDIRIRDILDGGTVQGCTVWFENATLQKNYTELLQKQKETLETEVVNLFDISHKDQLTGMGNRRYYEESVEQIRRRPVEKDLLVGLMDLNGLKKVNDSIGHEAGDELIRGASEVLNAVFAGEGKTFRIGGDEFFVIVCNSEKSAEDYEKALEKEMKNWHGKLVDQVSLAYGFACEKDHPEADIDELSRIADQAMYENKRHHYEQLGGK